MHYLNDVYRPPKEKDSVLLQVTIGCSHNTCRFCTMYKDEQFRPEPLDVVEGYLRQGVEIFHDPTRVFLVNGDAFVLPFERLEKIAKLIYKYMPTIKTISSYASVKNLLHKTDRELAQLRELGFNDLNVGLESGSDAILKYLNKDSTAAQAKEQLLRLNKFGYDYCTNVIFGAAGAQSRFENATETAKLLNEVQPAAIFVGTMHPIEGCPMFEDLKSGRFVESTYAQYMEEETLFLNLLQVENCYYGGDHPSNVDPKTGWLPQDKAKLLKHIEDFKATLPPQKLNTPPVHTGDEGFVARE